VAEVDQDAVFDQATHHRFSTGGEPVRPALGEDEVVDPVREEGERVGVRRDLAEDEVGDSDVADPPLAQLGAIGGDFLVAVAEVEAALDAVDQGGGAVGDRGIQLRPVVHEAQLRPVVRRNLLLDCFEVGDEPGEVAGLGRGSVVGVQVELVEGPQEDRHRQADPALVQGLGSDPVRPVPGGIVVDPVGEFQDQRLDAVAEGGPRRFHQPGRRLGVHVVDHPHRVVGVEVGDHRGQPKPL
jgi:hypothetical protein